MIFDTKGHLRAWIGATDDETSSLDSQYPLNDDWWHYIAISRHPNAQAMVLYVDGYMTDLLDLTKAPTLAPSDDLSIRLGGLQADYVDIAVWTFWSSAWEADTEGLAFGPPPEGTPGLLRSFDFTQAALPEGVTQAAHNWNVPSLKLGSGVLGLNLPKDQVAIDFGGGSPHTDPLGRYTVMAWLGVSLFDRLTGGAIVSTIIPKSGTEPFGGFNLNFSVDRGLMTYEVFDHDANHQILKHTVPAQTGLPSSWVQWTHVALRFDWWVASAQRCCATNN